MESEKLKYYLQTIQRMLNIPIVLGDGEDLYYFQPFTLSEKESELSFIVDRLKNVHARFPDARALYFLHETLVMFGIVADLENRRFVFIGPLAQQNATERDISDYLFAAGLSTDTTQAIAAYLNSVRPLTLNGLQQLLCNIDLILNDEMISVDDLVSIYDSENNDKILFAERELKNDIADDRRDIYLTENFNGRMQYCIINGDIDGLGDLLNQMDPIPFQEISKVDSLREFKIVAFGSVFAAETTALKSSVSAAELGRIKQFYLDRIDASRSIDDLRQLIISSLFEFTKCVKEHLYQKTDNPVIDRAINYIKANINSKLLIDDIAEGIRANAHYLFVRFKQETGKTMTQFINEEKIKKACYYLMFTDKSLAEISSYLSFSSQSYFQSIFKKVMGVTPTEWRRINTAVK